MCVPSALKFPCCYCVRAVDTCSLRRPAQEETARMRRLGLSVDDVVYSKVEHGDQLSIGSKGKVEGPGNFITGEDALDRILVVFDDGFRINMF